MSIVSIYLSKLSGFLPLNHFKATSPSHSRPFRINQRGDSGTQLDRYLLINQSINQRNWVFVSNLSFQIPISLPPDGVNLCFFKLRSFDLRSATLGCKDIGNKKSEFVAKAQFLKSLNILWKFVKNFQFYSNQSHRNKDSPHSNKEGKNKNKMCCCQLPPS